MNSGGIGKRNHRSDYSEYRHDNNRATFASGRRCCVKHHSLLGKRSFDAYESSPNPPAKRRSVASGQGFNRLINPDQFEELKKRSVCLHYAREDHSQYVTSVKHYTSARGRPLSCNRQNLLIPLLQAFKLATNWSWQSLTATAHPLASAGVFTCQQNTRQTVRDTHTSLLTELVGAVLHEGNQGPEARKIYAMGLANFLWAMAKLIDNGQPLTLQLKETVAALLPLVIVLRTEFKAQGVANQLWALAKLVENGLPLTPELKKTITTLQSRVIPLKNRFKPQEIASLMWATAKLLDNGRPMTLELIKTVTAMQTHVITLKARFKPQEIANLLWAVAKLVDSGQPLTAPLREAVAALLSCVYTLINAFKVRTSSNLLWAMAKLVDYGLPLTPEFKKTLAALLPCVQSMGDRFIPQNIANLLWAMAKMMDNGLPLSAELIKTITVLQPRVLALKANFKAQHIASLFWAMAKLVDIGHPLTSKFIKTLSALLPFTLVRNDQFTAQHLANLLWAMAKLVEHGQRPTPELEETVTTLLSRLSVLMDQFSSQGIANLLWAVAKLVDFGQALTPDLKEAITALLLRVIAMQVDFNPQEIANLLWALVKLMENGQPLTPELKETLPALLSQVNALKEYFSARAIANLLWATGSLGELINTEAADVLAAYLLREPDKYLQLTRQDLLMSLWGLLACSAKRYLEKSCLKERHLEKHRELNVHDKNDTADCLIKKLFTPLKHKPIEDELEKNIMAMAASWLRKKCPVEPHYQTTHSKPQSLFCAQLQSALPSLRVEQEKSLHSLPPVDLLLPEHNIVVEIQGPFHYVGRDFQTRNGATLLKTALLQRAGYDVIGIPVNQLRSPDSSLSHITQIQQKIAQGSGDICG